MTRATSTPTRSCKDARVSAPAPADDATAFYTPAEAARLARVPRHRISAWKRQGIVFPTVYVTDVERHLTAGYTFETLVYLRLLRMLRDQGIVLPKAVETVHHLRERFGPPGADWENARIFVQDSDVCVEGKDEWELTISTRGGQKAASLRFGAEFAGLRERADALLIPRQFRSTVEIDPEIRSGLPVVRRATMQTAVLHALRQRGQSLRAVQAAYPHLSLGRRQRPGPPEHPDLSLSRLSARPLVPRYSKRTCNGSRRSQSLSLNA